MKTLFYNTKPITTEQENPFNAFIVDAGVIIETGNFEKLKAGLSSADTIINLGGKTVIPGFTDSHIHLMAYAASKELNVNLKDIKSINALRDITDAFIIKKGLSPGRWVNGWGWNHDLFPDRRMPDRFDLDKISDKHPIQLTRMCYHICVVNSIALKAAGINENTPDPEGGKIDRDEHGKPTGILRETAMELIDRVKPPLADICEIKNLIRTACADLISCGFTCVHTDDFGSFSDRELLLKAYTELDEAGELPLDIVLQMIINKPSELDFYIEHNLHSGRRFNRLSTGPVKILGDGSLGSRTAALTEPYNDEPETKGFMLFAKETLEEMVASCFENSFDVAVHAIGDLTQQTVLEIFGRHTDLIKKENLRPSIIHCQIASPKILELYREHNIIANFQPIFIHSDWPIALERVGEERLKTSYCWQTFFDSGIFCVGSSDAPVESFNPFSNLYTAVFRKGLEGKPDGGWLPEEALSRREALNLFTLYPPKLTGEEMIKGQLKKGYAADFAVLSGDPLTVSEDELKDLTVLATYKGGVPVYHT
jgi:predicted amidohydrolase YtcJ